MARRTGGMAGMAGICNWDVLDAAPEVFRLSRSLCLCAGLPVQMGHSSQMGREQGAHRQTVNHATQQENTQPDTAETGFNHQKPEECQPVTQNKPEQSAG